MFSYSINLPGTAVMVWSTGCVILLVCAYVLWVLHSFFIAINLPGTAGRVVCIRQGHFCLWVGLPGTTTFIPQETEKYWLDRECRQVWLSKNTPGVNIRIDTEINICRWSDSLLSDVSQCKYIPSKSISTVSIVLDKTLKDYQNYFKSFWWGCYKSWIHYRI